MELSYRPGLKKVLDGLSFEMEAGHKVGVVGRTGCGKSTAVLALSRLIEIGSGKISVDGVDISKVNLHLLRDKITVIPQESVIFDATIKFNLDPSGKVKDDVIKTLLLEAGLDDLLKRAPEKDHELNEELDIDSKEDFGNGRGIYFKLTDVDSLSSGEK